MAAIVLSDHGLAFDGPTPSAKPVEPALWRP